VQGAHHELISREEVRGREGLERQESRTAVCVCVSWMVRAELKLRELRGRRAQPVNLSSDLREQALG